MLIFAVFYLFIIPSLARGAGLEQLEHIIIFMQENRPFDHYFGTLSGVRGFNDRTTVPLKSGLNAFYQPVNSSETEYMLPYRVDANKVAQFIFNVLFNMS
jgi:phospholipase C